MYIYGIKYDSCKIINPNKKIGYGAFQENINFFVNFLARPVKKIAGVVHAQV